MILLNTKEKDLKYIMHTYGRYDVALKSGKGAVAYDENGKKYIDVSSGIGVNSLGYCNDGWVDAVTKQAGTIQHMSNYFYSEQASNLAEKLCTLTGLSKVCFGNSGAEANECAIKIARKYSFDKYGEGRNGIITLKNSFHGRTVTTLSATGQDVFHNYFFPFTEGFSYVEAEDMNALKNAVNKNTCAVMLELIQGEGGVNILDKDYVQSLVKFCNENDILVIVDEVQTGIGRTGKLFAFENYEILPDLVTVAKGLGGGLPIGLCMCGEKLKDVMSPSTHGTTFGANPVVCAGANYVLDTITADGFLDEVNKKGEYIEEKVSKLENVKNVRRMGLMIGVELESGNAHDIAIKCVENGLLIITAKNLLRMLPPLVITYDEIDEALKILETTLETTLKEND
ncbi:MAG: aspartate aminotransferase family protein [Ruminococcus sp.]